MVCQARLNNQYNDNAEGMEHRAWRMASERTAALEERFTRGALRLRQWNEKHGAPVK
jgi:hypothetical protein